MTFDPCQHGTLTEPHRPTAPHGRDAARMLAARPGRMHAPVAVVVGLAAHAEDLCGFRRADALAADAGCHLTSLPICPPASRAYMRRQATVPVEPVGPVGPEICGSTGSAGSTAVAEQHFRATSGRTERDSTGQDRNRTDDRSPQVRASSQVRT